MSKQTTEKAWPARIAPPIQLAVAVVSLYNNGRQALRLLDGRDPETSGLVLGIVFSTVAVVIAAPSLWSRGHDFSRGLIFGAGLVALAGLGLLLWSLWATGEGINIDSPASGEAVSRVQIVRGSFEKIPDDESIWVAIVPLGLEEYRYHPQSPATKMSGGKWQATAFIGLDSPEDRGRQFDIHALRVDERGEQSLLKYLDGAQATGSFPGLLSLPTGVVSYDHVIVVRDGSDNDLLTPTPTPSKGTVTISEPTDGEAVGHQVTVSGRYSGLRANEVSPLHVLVKPLPKNPDIPWFVQDPATLKSDGTWSNRSYVGAQDDDPGTTYVVCALITREELKPGQELPRLPEGTSDCVEVTREGVPAHTPTETVVTRTPNYTATPTPGPRILTPAQGESVPVVIAVEFESSEPACVLVRPNPDDPRQDYWVQSEPAATGPNRWESSPVYVGQEADPSGTPFRICVVIPDEPLPPDQSLRELPEGRSHCVDVTREGTVPSTPTPTRLPNTSTATRTATPPAESTPSPALTPTSAATELPTPVARILLEAEAGTGEGQIMQRSAASNERTVWLHAGESRVLPLRLATGARYRVSVRYSNDNLGQLETVRADVDGVNVGQFQAQDTGGEGTGWNIFEWSGPLGDVKLQPGAHEVKVSVTGGDGYGVEIDVLALDYSQQLAARVASFSTE